VRLDGDIRRAIQNVVTLASQLIRRLCQALWVARDERQTRARDSECFGDTSANASAAACDDGYLAGEAKD